MALLFDFTVRGWMLLSFSCALPWQALDLHIKMIREFGGVPGVQSSRLLEGINPRHCALSLVGEPIMYPKINELVTDLHAR